MPRVGLLLGDIALLGAALHCLVASVMASLTGAAPLMWSRGEHFEAVSQRPR